MRSTSASIAAALVISGLVTGCAPRETGTLQGDETGWALPTQGPGETLPGTKTAIQGVLRVESNGCFVLELPEGERRWVVWPEGTLQVDSSVTLDGASWNDGDRLVAVGALVTPDAIAGWADTDGHIRELGEFCDAERLGAVVLDSAAPDGTG